MMKFMLLAAFAASCISARAATVDIAIANFQFGNANATVTVNLGDTVRWTNADPEPHIVISGPTWGQPDNKFASGALNPNDTYSVTFRRPGTFGYYCDFHPGMFASIKVLPAAAKTVTVTVQNTRFGTNNETTNVNIGDSVEWVWVNGIHTVTSGTVVAGVRNPDGKFNASITTSSTKFTFTFSTAGTYPYYCSPHALCCSMVSSVVVAAGPIYGDVNGSGSVDALDAAEVLRVWSGLAALPADHLAIADVYPTQFGDGIVDLRDAVRILRFVGGADTTPL